MTLGESWHKHSLVWMLVAIVCAQVYGHVSSRLGAFGPCADSGTGQGL
jgi:hypothetical protein